MARLIIYKKMFLPKKYVFYVYIYLIRGSLSVDFWIRDIIMVIIKVVINGDNILIGFFFSKRICRKCQRYFSTRLFFFLRKIQNHFHVSQRDSQRFILFLNRISFEILSPFVLSHFICMWYKVPGYNIIILYV